jgi:hypothetical protein
VPLQLVIDATGATPNLQTSPIADPQFIYEYLYPTDCSRVRYIPFSPLQNPGAPVGNITPPNPSSPLMTNLSPTTPAGQRIVPSKFIVTNDPNVTAVPGSSWMNTKGSSPIGTTVVCTNTPNATMVYTFAALYPQLWDDLFYSALVAYVAAEIAGPLWVDKDPRMAMKMRDEQYALLKIKLNEARVADGNEGTFSSDIPVDWMQFRRTGGGYMFSGYGAWGAGYGCWGSGWAGSVSMGGSSY